MFSKIVEGIAERFVSRWLIFFLDLCIVATFFIFAYYIRLNFNVSDADWVNIKEQLPSILSLYTIGFLVFKSFTGIIRHTTLSDLISIFRATTFSSGLIILITGIVRLSDWQVITSLDIPISVSLIAFLLNISGLSASRLFIKAMYRYSIKSAGTKTRVMIYGAGESGRITKNTLANDSQLNVYIVGFIDENPQKTGKTIGGVKVYSPKEAFSKNFIKSKGVQEVILSIQELKAAKRRKIIDVCLKRNLKIKNVPPVKDWIHGELSAKQIKQVRIEDLLNREPISLNNQNIKNFVKEKVVMVTGAAGSIGSEIARQLLHYGPEKVILLDQAESPLYEVEFEIKQNGFKCNQFEVVIADVSNVARMRRVYEAFEPDVVFHAAAYKHVPMMEHNPMEAVAVNIMGTKIVADLAVEYKVEKFVMVSTDKAVNPTNVMGASKRVAEIYTQALNEAAHNPRTQFITTRFGNVLGSNGSVIPIFRKQIESGGPITVTSPEITRYFMTIPEACQLVLEAGSMGQGGEIFIFDMGESVKIIDVAKKMIKLSGLELGKDIEIKISGLRPGEKLYEELLNTKENTVPTHHQKIMVAKVRTYDFDTIYNELKDMSNMMEHATNEGLVRKIKAIVPEYVSKNSIYEALDKKDETTSKPQIIKE